jgi:hypothetical protein
VLIGTHNHGQGHETTFAQIVGEKLGVPFENIDIVFGDTDKVQFGMGTYGSRSLVVGGPALAKASDKVIAKGKKIAAHLLEASEQDITFERGTFSVIDTDHKIPRSRPGACGNRARRSRGLLAAWDRRGCGGVLRRGRALWLQWLVDRMREAGLNARIDGIGNILGMSDVIGRIMLAGSHIETQNRAGWLDGALGGRAHSITTTSSNFLRSMSRSASCRPRWR